MTNDNSLGGKVVLVTGAARRIGAGICRTLHSAGADVIIHFRGSSEAAENLREDLNSIRPDSAISLQADLADSEAITQLVASALAWRGSLDVLVNNASSFYPTPIGEISENDWLDLVGTNLKAPLFLAQAAAASLHDSGGVIINIVDVHAQRPLRNHSVYGAAKAGLAMLTRSLAKDLAPRIRVNGVSPGAILWPEGGLDEATRDAILGQVPLGRVGDVQDIASCVLYLVRDATYVTGQIIAVDGGRSIGW